MNALSKLLLIRRIKTSFYRWDEALLRDHQAERVANILAYAKSRSPYYHTLLLDQNELSLSSVPEIDKAELMEHFDEINTAGLHRDELVQFRIRQEKEGGIDLYDGQFSVGLSSGTSGNKCLAVLSKAEREKYSCLLWARCGIPERVKRRRVLFALRTNNPAFTEVGALGAKIAYVDYTHPPDELVQLINEKALNILAGPPSLLAMIAERHDSIDHRIDALISYAEVLDDATRTHLEQAFQAPVAQIYQGAEGFIGSTCRRGKLHLNEDTILAELHDAGDRIGGAKRVVITDLYRTTVPIIRYSLNDVLEISPEPCECGSCFRVIERIHGRTDDIFYLAGPDGEVRHLFPDYVRRSINQASDAILEYQAIQHSLQFIEIRLLLREGADRATIERAVGKNLREWAVKAGGSLGQITFANNPPERNPRSHKLIRVVRRF